MMSFNETHHAYGICKCLCVVHHTKIPPCNASSPLINDAKLAETSMLMSITQGSKCVLQEQGMKDPTA